MEKYIEMVASLGLKGQEAVEFVRDQQIYAREEREKRREDEQAEEERRQAEREHELTLAHLSGSNNSAQTNIAGPGKTPKLPAFVDGTDDLASFLLRFERFAKQNQWPENKWAVNLSVLLSGRALDVYSRMSDETADNYALLKTALQKRYNLTEEGYRKRFRNCKPEKGESAEQYIFRINGYLSKWLDLLRVRKILEFFFMKEIQHQ